MQSINLEYPDILKDFNIIFIRAMTKQYVRDSEISVYKKFLKEVKAFFIKCAKYLQTKINASVDVKSLTFLVCLKGTKLC